MVHGTLEEIVVRFWVISCKKWEMDSQRKFRLILCHKPTAVWSKWTPNSMTVPCHLSSIICFPCSNMTWILHFISSSHGIFKAFAKKMMGFPSDLLSFSNQTKLRSKRHEKIPVTFFTGWARENDKVFEDVKLERIIK